MGEPVTVVQSNTADPSRVRFETNRSFTGMGHERYSEGQPIHTDRPPDVLAGLLFESGQVADVHIYAQTVTVTLKKGHDAQGLKEIIEDLYIHYKPGVPIPTEADFA